MNKTEPRTFTNKEGKPIGTLSHGTFYKKVQKSKHYMRVFDAWGIEAYVVDTWQGDCVRIVIEETENDLKWETPIHVFLSRAFTRDFSTPQYFLERKYWTITNRAGQVLQERTVLREELEDKQAKLPL